MRLNRNARRIRAHGIDGARLESFAEITRPERGKAEAVSVTAVIHMEWMVLP